MKKFFQILLIILASINIVFSALVFFLMLQAFATPLVLIVAVVYFVISLIADVILLIPLLILCGDKLFRIGLFINLGAVMLDIISTIILIIL